MTWTTHNLWDGCFRAAMVKLLPKWIHHGCLDCLTCLGTVMTQTYRRETARVDRISNCWGEVNGVAGDGSLPCYYRANLAWEGG